MKPLSLSALSLSTLSFIGLGICPMPACGKSERPDGPGFQIGVAPLSLPGVTNACYRVTVTNGPDRSGDIVWQEDSLCADDFGDGTGSLAYVGPCDASVTRDNSVTVELIDLMAMTGTSPAPIDDDEYDNPCGVLADWSSDRNTLAIGEDPYAPCTINKACVENSDVPVEFNLTVMRDANQGFFDIAVEFDDIFCSAKLDCKAALLHDAEGNRAATAVVGFACTAGENEQTYMYVSDLVLTCDGLPALPPMVIAAAAATPGQHGPIGSGIFEWAAYQDDEELTSNGQPLEKCFWNRAVGLDLAVLGTRTCSLSGVGTASDLPLTPAMLNSPGVSYPIVRWSVDVLSAGSLCANNELNMPGSGVKTEYVGPSTPTTNAAFASAAAFACGAPDPILCAAGPITGDSNGAPSNVTVRMDGDTLTVETGTRSSGPIALPGYSLAGCHQDACCSQ